jgi:hypothetical protein
MPFHNEPKYVKIGRLTPEYWEDQKLQVTYMNLQNYAWIFLLEHIFEKCALLI